MLTHNDESCLDSKDGSAFLDITGGTPPYKIDWSSDPIDNTNGIDSLPPGSYAVTVTDANGLTKNATFVVIASEAVCKIHIYTGITPNGDGHDDTWVIDNIEVFPDNSVDLYNRWGSEVWHATGYDNSKVVWRGENQNGKPLPDGTYYYVVKVNGTTYKGWVQLTR
jgi:gliding motility-associated-like protein